MKVAIAYNSPKWSKLDFNFVALGFTYLNHTLKHRTLYKQLHCLVIKFSSSQLASIYYFKSKHSDNWMGALIVATFTLPFLRCYNSYSSKVSSLGWGGHLQLSVLTYEHIFSWWSCCLCSSLPSFFITLIFVIGSVSWHFGYNSIYSV